MEKESDEVSDYFVFVALGFAGCYGTGPYASANSDGPVVDLSACAQRADTRVDPLCIHSCGLDLNSHVRRGRSAGSAGAANNMGEFPALPGWQ